MNIGAELKLYFQISELQSNDKIKIKHYSINDFLISLLRDTHILALPTQWLVIINLNYAVLYTPYIYNNVTFMIMYFI